MSNEQLYLAIGVPIIFNAVLMAVLIAFINAKFGGANFSPPAFWRWATSSR